MSRRIAQSPLTPATGHYPGTHMFDPSSVRAFRAIRWQFDETSGIATFEYALVSDTQKWPFTEHIAFPPNPSAPLTPARRAVVDRLLAHLFVAAAISYYKAAAPPLIQIEQGSYADAEIDFHRLVLERGLGEYCFHNGLDLLRPHFEYRSTESDRAAPVEGLALDGAPLIPVGGGKDSCVTIEAHRAAHPTLITVNRYPVIQAVIDAAELPDLLVRRTIDARLLELNHQGALNGHVPITTIVSLCVLIAAVMHGHPEVIMSNERSASEGNVVYRGVEINHQWSKSVELEEALQRLLATITPELTWSSYLRPWSELAIVDRFVRTGQRYLDVFSSCNAAFRLDPTRRTTRWCGRCPKCQFVFLALATVLPRATLEHVFGNDLFLTSQTDGFEALLGLTESKPFECVGESGECRVALRVIAERDEWRDHPVVAELACQVRARGVWPSLAELGAVYAPA